MAAQARQPRDEAYDGKPSFGVNLSAALDKMRLIDRPEVELFSMHENDIVQSVFEIIGHRLQGARVVRVARGQLFELSEKSILAAWREFTLGKPLEKIELKFRPIRAEVQCMACFEKYHPEDGVIHCPHCGSFGAKILQGEEFYLESIETENE